MTSRYETIYRTVRCIPHGMVASYGQVADAAGLGRHHARQVGYALHALQDDETPWHRVVNRDGEVTNRSNADYQRVRLLEEGVTFDARGRVDRTCFVDTERLRR